MWEDDADELVRDWGFSSTAMDEWDRSHVFEEPAPDPVLEAQVAALEAQLVEIALRLGIKPPGPGAGPDPATA